VPGLLLTSSALPFPEVVSVDVAADVACENMKRHLIQHCAGMLSS
jgi:hypothetical protein